MTSRCVKPGRDGTEFQDVKHPPHNINPRMWDCGTAWLSCQRTRGLCIIWLPTHGRGCMISAVTCSKQGSKRRWVCVNPFKVATSKHSITSFLSTLNCRLIIIIIIIIIFVYYNCSQTAQSYSTNIRHAGPETTATTQGSTMYRRVKPAKLLPHTAHSDWINRTGLTSWAFTRWCDRHTSDKVAHYSIYRPRKDERLSWPWVAGYIPR